MHSSTLLTIFVSTFAAVASSSSVSASVADSSAIASSTSDALNTVNLDKALSLASSSEVHNEKRTLGLIKAAFTWCSALLNQGICYNCGSSNLGCSNACCRCGATTQISCSTC